MGGNPAPQIHESTELGVLQRCSALIRAGRQAGRPAGQGQSQAKSTPRMGPSTPQPPQHHHLGDPWHAWDPQAWIWVARGGRGEPGDPPSLSHPHFRDPPAPSSRPRHPTTPDRCRPRRAGGRRRTSRGSPRAGGRAGGRRGRAGAGGAGPAAPSSTSSASSPAGASRRRPSNASAHAASPLAAAA